MMKKKRRNELSRWWFYISTTENRVSSSSFLFFSFAWFSRFYSYVSSFQTSFLICVPLLTNTKANEYTKRYLMKQHAGDVTTLSLLSSRLKIKPQAKLWRRKKVKRTNSSLILRSNTNNNLSSVTNVDEYQRCFLNINL